MLLIYGTTTVEYAHSNVSSLSLSCWLTSSGLLNTKQKIHHTCCFRVCRSISDPRVEPPMRATLVSLLLLTLPPSAAPVHLLVLHPSPICIRIICMYLVSRYSLRWGRFDREPQSKRRKKKWKIFTPLISAKVKAARKIIRFISSTNCVRSMMF